MTAWASQSKKKEGEEDKKEQKKEQKKKLNKRLLHQKCSRLRLSSSLFLTRSFFFSRLLLLRCRQIGCVKSQAIAAPPLSPIPVSSAQRCYNKKSPL